MTVLYLTDSIVHGPAAGFALKWLEEVSSAPVVTES